MLRWVVLVLWFEVSWAFTFPERSPAEAGLDPQHIQAAIEQIQSGEVGHIRSLLIIKDGYLITEQHFNSQGEKRPVFSVTKSIGSALLGIAQQQGAVIDLQASILDYLPQYNNIPNQAQVRHITLHDLLTQRHGYRWDEWSTPFTDPANPVYQMMGTRDWYRTATQWSVLTSPDQIFAYSSGHSSLMSPILNNRTGRGVYEFARDELFAPLGITDTDWNVFDPRAPDQGITQFPQDLEPLGFGLWMKPLDLAKFGELYRLNGQWQGEQLLSADWISQSVSRYSDGTTDPQVFNSEFSGYGYQWWVTRMTDDLRRSFDMYYASGFGRQYVFVIPQLDAVIVSTAADYGTSAQTPGIGTVMREHLLLAFNPDEPGRYPLTSDLNGSWYNPANDGQGINFEVQPDGETLVGYWYTYEPDGGHQRWFLLQGTVVDDVARFSIISSSGGVFQQPDEPDLALWGSGELEVNDCFNGTMRFTSEVEQVSGEMPLARLTLATGGCVQAEQHQTLGPRLH